MRGIGKRFGSALAFLLAAALTLPAASGVLIQYQGLVTEVNNFGGSALPLDFPQVGQTPNLVAWFDDSVTDDSLPAPLTGSFADAMDFRVSFNSGTFGVEGRDVSINSIVETPTTFFAAVGSGISAPIGLTDLFTSGSSGNFVLEAAGLIAVPELDKSPDPTDDLAVIIQAIWDGAVPLPGFPAWRAEFSFAAPSGGSLGSVVVDFNTKVGEIDLNSPFIPEPGTFAMFGVGVGLLGLRRR
ncbi:MAG: PEP-CTERM sorting domain-containing protein [Planctomycetota bacterium]